MDDLVQTAESAAKRLLAAALPRRWNHVQAVAAAATQVADSLPFADRPVLIAAAWLHDVGYAPDVVDTGLHSLDGARWLAQNGYDPRIASLVAYHSCAVFEAQERGLADALQAEFQPERSAVSDALWYADMTTGPDGQNLGVGERLAEVRSRYGPGDVVTRTWERAEPVLREAVNRVRGRQPR